MIDLIDFGRIGCAINISLRLVFERASPWGEVASQSDDGEGISLKQRCTSQQILDTNHKKIYNKKLSVSQISVRNATCDIELASDSLTNKLDAVH